MQEKINTKNLYVGRIKYKSHIPGQDYIITTRYVFKKFKYKNETLFQEILDGLIYTEDEEMKVIDLEPFNEVFPSITDPTKEIIMNLLFEMQNEDIKNENIKRMKLN